MSGQGLSRSVAHVVTIALSAEEYLEHGAALLRAGRAEEAREPLRRAVDIAHRRGAVALEELALAELRAAGGRPRRRVLSGVGALTASERRVAELAAAGRMNREIADALVVTIDTVEFHLRNAYRKLGLTSRAGLARALGVRRGRRLTLSLPSSSVWGYPANAATATMRL
jgi:DNA-binding CsgD family transcriptional regulator